VLTGWLAVDGMVNWELVTMVGRGGQIPYRRTLRPDVEATFPGLAVMGFSCLLGAEELSVSAPEVRMEMDGAVVAHLELRVEQQTVELVAQLRAARAAKRGWILEHARCPDCRNPLLEMGAEQIRCGRCGAAYEQRGEVVNFLSAELYRQCALQESPNVSMNAYDYIGWQLVHQATGAGGKVLDCGAGLRTVPSETVVNLEIVDLPSTDVMGVGQSLPFRDGCFDAVLSYAVLEHVSDPFLCAREMVRVLKPGGEIYCHVPFLQPEHGYPNHFYNMTRAGLRNLFSDLVELEHTVPESGEPVLALHWIVSHYAAGLGGEARERFLGMTMGDLVGRGSNEWLKDEMVLGLAEKVRWELACTTALRMKKPSF
jgi:LSD1 subclass zinc finger protein